ncbi:MAG: D-alanyl-D-alanine carboxypeptidase family protein [Candidatus Krumholzibacteriia bacterium]
MTFPGRRLPSADTPDPEDKDVMLMPDSARRLPRHCRPLTILLVTWSLAVFAVEAPEPAAPAAPAAPAEVDGDFATAILIDADSGMVLAAKDPDVVRQPASMLKMLTELIVLERVAEGDIHMDDLVTVSARASRMGGSQVYLAQGEEFTVGELLAALAIQSANDAAVALAEHTAGSVEAFVDLMNDRARRLGLQHSEFHTVHGLPPGRGQEPDLTTARDMATIGRALLAFPEALGWASQSTAPFRDGAFTMYNPNKLVGQYRGLDGLKTGYHGQAGYCVTATAVQKGVRLLSVVMGCSSDRARATETTRLLSFGFNLYETVTLVDTAGAPTGQSVPVTDGKAAAVAANYADPLEVNVPRDQKDQVQLRYEFIAPLNAPVAAGEKVGEAVAVLGGHILGRVDLVAAATVEKGNWLNRLFH